MKKTIQSISYDASKDLVYHLYNLMDSRIEYYCKNMLLPLEYAKITNAEKYGILKELDLLQ